MAKYSNRLEDDLKLSDAAITVLERRYLKKDSDGKPIETARDMFRRVAYNIAEADSFYKGNIEEAAEKFYGMMSHLYFLPNSPTLMNAGRELQQLSACFVLPIGDSIDEIFEAAKQGALVHKSGGGTGYSFSKIRPNGDIVKSTDGIASGPVSFMNVFNIYTDVVKQGGTRRGANMGVLNVHHPDIIEFINSKNVLDEKNLAILKGIESKSNREMIGRRLIESYQLNNFNISIALTGRFMDAVEKDKEYELINPSTRKVVKKLKARDVFNKIAENACANGEPGIIFIDRINKYNPTLEIGEIESTNPCGEQPLLPYESCNLGSINLSKFVKNNKVDYENLEKIVENSVHFLDNVIDMNHYPLEQTDIMTKANRKIGLGVMGFADMLIQLGIPYNSEDAIRVAGEVMSFIQEKSKKYSALLAEKRGCFPNIEKSIYRGKLMRNATTTTIAPTGTIGVIASCSSGIEPPYKIVYKRKTPQFELFEVNSEFKKIMEEKELYSEKLVKKIYEEGTIKNLDLPEEIKNLFITAHDVNPEQHVAIQAEFQKHVDNAVSKTINFPHSATVDDIKKAYLLANKLGCKGVTVYRDGSRLEQVLNVGVSEKKNIEKIVARTRPQVTDGSTIKMRTGCGKMYVTVNEDEQGPCEIFTVLGKSGGCTASQSEAISRLVSLALRSGLSYKEIIEQLKGIRCSQPTLTEGGSILSCADAIAQVMEIYLKKKGEEPITEETNPSQTTNHNKQSNSVNLSNLGICPQCPECGNGLSYEEGCILCHSCGYSRCE